MMSGVNGKRKNGARQDPTPFPLYLGIECGGTRTRVCLAEASGRAFRERTLGPANLKLLTDAQLVSHLRSIKSGLPDPLAMAIGMAGARTASDWARVRKAAARVWPGIPCHATHDLEIALLTGGSTGDGASPATSGSVLVLSGTGSCCYGRAADGTTAKMGGWGHLLGDKGSGFDIAMRALKAVVYYYDRDGEWSDLGPSLLRALALNEPNDLIEWVRDAGKAEIAALAPVVFAAASRRDSIASDILTGAASTLAKDAVSCARRLAGHGSRVRFILAGGVLLGQRKFAQRVAALIRQSWKNAQVHPSRREAVWGAIELARRLARQTESKGSRQGGRLPAVKVQENHAAVHSLATSPTEARHPKSMHLDRMSLGSAVRLMLSEEAKVPGAILKEHASLERAVALVARCLGKGGRLIYVGAGTSGRLGVLDASECPPTFQTDPEMVQGIIAGGTRALWSAVEGAEDDAEAGARAAIGRGVSRHDVVVGIAASGRTPFVWGALRAAKRRGAKTVLVSFNPHLELPRSDRPTLSICPQVGPEILTGSTRLKAGTATKLILNILTTLTMVQLGKVSSNLMIALKASNTKLRDRALRITQALTGANAADAQSALLKAGWNIKQACLRLKKNRNRGRNRPLR